MLFNTTIRENMKFGNPNATDDDIIKALKEANAYNFINKFEEGINMHVGQAGGLLSGG